MEDKNYNNDFEQFLRNSIEDFKMIPSRKIWYGIYNNMHPDRKWPSIAVCLIILAVIMFVGVANNNSISSSARKNAAENLLAGTSIVSADQNKVSSIVKPQTSFSKTAISTSIPEKILSYSKSNVNYRASIYSESSTTQVLNELTVHKKNNINNIADVIAETSNKISNNFIVEKNISQINNEAIANSLNKENENIQQVDAKMVIHINNGSTTNIDNNFEKNTIAKINATETEKSLVKNSTTLIDEKIISEINAAKHQAHKRKLKENGSMNYYFTPSFGYRNISNNQNNIKAISTSNAFAASTNAANTMQQMKDVVALNLEAGVAFQYKLSKNIRLKTGLQANYTNYISKVTELYHPTQTTLAVTGQQNNVRGSSYNTREGNTNLNKTNWQVSLPIGMDIKIAGNDKLNWYIGATAQPTYVLSDNSFVLSTDARYYIYENGLLNKFNLNTSVETFISFKPSANVTLQVGPQFRYQIFSSYKKAYNYSEKLYNVGVKVGLTTNF